MAVSLVIAALLGAISPESAAQTSDAGNWIATHCVRDEAFTVRPDGEAVSGYFGNITALGLVAARTHLALVNDWMGWYIRNAHGSGSGVDGVPDDGHYVGGTFVSRGRPDSTDAYGATFISLANAAYDSGDPQLRATIASDRPDLERIAASMLATLQSIGLTTSRPQHAFAYAIDNEQVYRGLLDAAALWSNAYGDAGKAEDFRAKAMAVHDAIERVLWDPLTQSYRPTVDATGRGATADFSRAYPDALAQVFAVVYGVVAPGSPRATQLIQRSSPALLAPLHGDAVEYREVLALAQARSHVAVSTAAAFDPAGLCSDAGWYLLQQSER
jgi:hypothetical protein